MNTVYNVVTDTRSNLFSLFHPMFAGKQMKLYKKTFCTKILFCNKIYKRKIFVPKAYSLNKLTRTFMFPANLMTHLSLRFS